MATKQSNGARRKQSRDKSKAIKPKKDTSYRGKIKRKPKKPKRPTYPKSEQRKRRVGGYRES